MFSASDTICAATLRWGVDSETVSRTPHPLTNAVHGPYKMSPSKIIFILARYRNLCSLHHLLLVPREDFLIDNSSRGSKFGGRHKLLCRRHVSYSHRFV